jgi:hypothetical protein
VQAGEIEELLQLQWLAEWANPRYLLTLISTSGLLSSSESDMAGRLSPNPLHTAIDIKLIYDL